MTFSTKQFSLLFLFTFLSCSLNIHARDPQFFNKIPATTTTNYHSNDQEFQNKQQLDFVPDNENSYGLYGHESGQFPPSSTLATESTSIPYNKAESEQPLNKHLPRNYNPVAYVTEPNNINDDTKFSGETSFATNPNNVAQNYDNNEQEEEEDFDYTRTTSSNNGNYYYNGGSSFNSQPQGLSNADFSTGVSLSRENNVNNGGYAKGFQPQGMSDTRFLENGKYFYDVNIDKYSNDHPYERIRERNENANRNSYGNTGNAYRFSNGNQNQYEENYLP